jgi:hypothetical protein
MPEASRSSSHLPTIAARHLVSFYEHSHYPINTVCDYLTEGLRGGEAVVAVATSEHAEWITNALRARGLRVDELISNGRLTCADVMPALAQWLDPSIPKQEKNAHMERWVQETVQRAPAHSCRFLGEMVSVMVARGSVNSAFELEDIWNHLLAEYPAMLYCAYEQTPFERSPGLNNFCDVCNRHDAVLESSPRAKESREASAWFVILQEQASTLRAEVMRRRMAERLVFVNEANRLTQLEALLRTHGPSLSPVEKNDIIKIVNELKAQAWKEKRVAVPESPEWHKKTGEILGYEKVITSVMNASKKPNGDPTVS